MSKHTFLLSDESVNSHGYKVKTEGIDTTDFMQNPVMLYEHDSLNLIGKWDNVQAQGNRLTGTPVFDTEDELGAKVQRRVKAGFLNGASIGIQPLEVGTEVLENNVTVPVILRSRLFEASICALPANRNALRLYSKEGTPIDTENIKEFLLSFHKPPTVEDKPLDPPNKPKMKLTAENLKSLGLDENAGEEQINQKLAEVLSLAQTTANALKTLQEGKVDALVSSAVAAGKITADKSDHFKKLATADYDATKAIIDGMAKPAKPTEYLNTQKPAGTAGRDDWTFDRWRKEDPAGLLALKTQDVEKYNALLTAANIKIA